MEIIVNIYLATSDSLRHAESDIFYVRPTNYVPHMQSLVPWGHCWHGDAAAREKFSQHHVGGLASWASHLFFLKYESLDGTLALGYLISSHIFCSFATLSSAHSSRLILSNNHQCQEGGVPSKVPRSHCQAAGALTYFLSHDSLFLFHTGLESRGLRGGSVHPALRCRGWVERILLLRSENCQSWLERFGWDARRLD